MKRTILLLIVLLTIVALYRPNPAIGQAQTRRDGKAAIGRIQLHGYDFDPIADAVPTALGRSVANLTADGFGLFIVQLNTTTTDELLDTLTPHMQFVQYIPHEAYIVWAAQNDLDNIANRNADIRWIAPFFPEFRTDVTVRETIARGERGAITLNATLIDAGTLDAIEQLGAQIDYSEAWRAMDVTLSASHLRFTIDASALAQLRDLPGMISLERFEMPQVHDDASANRVAVQTETESYARWLAQTGWNGNGVKVAINDTGIDWDHPDLQNVTSGFDASSIYSEPNEPGSDGACDQTTPRPPNDAAPCFGNEPGHGTHVAGIVAATNASNLSDATGTFSSNDYGVGIAPGAQLHAYNAIASGGGFPSYLSLAQNARTNSATLSNNSYGSSTGAGYTATARNIDAASLDITSGNGQQDTFLWVFSAGNSGNGDGFNGPCPVVGGTNYPCINSMGQQGYSKNAITVGSSNSPRSTNPNAGINTISSFSSRGFAVNGLATQTRIKPDIVAAGDLVINTENRTVGAGGVVNTSCGVPASSAANSTIHTFCSGTSMAAPQIAGVAALFTEYWRDVTGDPTAHPAPALIKAAMIATADDMGGGNDGWGNTLGSRPNPHQGWGRINADRLLNPSVPVLFFENPHTFDAGNTPAWTLNFVPADTSHPVYITLVWDDAPGAAGSNAPLVNDLDIDIYSFNSGLYFCGNELQAGFSLASNGCQNDPDSIADRVNNVESLFFPNSMTGLHQISVIPVAINGDGVPESGDATDQNFSLVCYNCLAQQHVDDSTDDGLVAYYKLDEARPDIPTRYIDMSGEENHLTFGAFPSSPTTETPNTKFANHHALELFGLGVNHVGAPNSSSLAMGDEVTVAAWVKLDDPSDNQKIVAKLTLGPPKQGFVLGVEDGELYPEVVDSSGTLYTFRAGTISADTWTHVAMTYVKGGYLTAYVDGVAVDWIGVGNFPVSNSSGGLYIGAASWNTDEFRVNGFIDEVRVYNQALKSAEIARLAAGYDCETDGATWYTAHHHLQCALTTAAQYPTVDRIDIAQGFYTPGTNRRATFDLPLGVDLYGGYPDGGGTRDRLLNPTILSGDLDFNDGAGAAGITGRNAINVVTINNEALVNGVVIEHGNADGSGGDWVGAGVFAGSAGDVHIQETTVRDNFASFSGAGMFNNGGSTYIDRTAFVGNAGGDLRLQFGNNAHISNSIFSGATVNDARVSVDNVRFFNNTVSGNAREFTFANAVDLNVQNNIFWGNNNGGSQFVLSGVTGSNFVNNIVQNGYTGATNIGDDPLFVDADGADDTFGTMDDNVRLRANSPAIDSGIVQSGYCASGQRDYVGTPRPFDGDGDDVAACDRGAFEFGALLLVDDDNNLPDVLESYRTALDGLDVPYEVWDGKTGQNEIPAAFFNGFKRVVWFTGAVATARSGFDGPTSAEETALSNWLDSSTGDCFFISSPDYRFAAGSVTPFMQTYLGVDNVAEQSYTRIIGQGSVYSGINFYYSLASRYVTLTDRIVPNGSAESAFRELDTGNTVGINKQTPLYTTTYLGFPLDLLPAAQQQATLDAFLTDCANTVVPTAVTVSQATATQRNVLTLIGLNMLLLFGLTIYLRQFKRN